MTRPTLVQSLKKLWHADGKILDLKARRFGFRIVLISLVALIAGISVATAAIGIFIALSSVVGGAVAAAIVSASSMGIAIALMAIASQGLYAQELKSAENDHMQAVESLKAEIQRFDIYDPKQSTPLVEAILPMIAPLVSALVVEGLRQRREAEASGTELPAQEG